MISCIVFLGKGNAETERYDPAFNSWTTLKLPLPNDTFSLAVVNGQIHAMYQTQLCEEVEDPWPHFPAYRRPTAVWCELVIKRYDVELCTWETLLSSQESHYQDDSCIVAFGNCLYILGGGCSNKASRFDTVESKWEEIASMPISESSPCGVATQGKIFVTSARGQQCEVYQVSTNEWHTIPSLNFTRVFSRSLVCLNETVYVVDVAEQNSSQPAEIVVNSYDPKLNKWIQKTSIPLNKSPKEETYSFQCSTLKRSKGLLTKPKIVTIG